MCLVYCTVQEKVGEILSLARLQLYGYMSSYLPHAYGVQALYKPIRIHQVLVHCAYSSVLDLHVDLVGYGVKLTYR